MEPVRHQPRPDPLALCGQLGSRSATSIAGTARGPHIEATLVSGNFRQFVLELMHRQVSPAVMEGLWNKRFPGQIPERLVMAERLESDTFNLEGHDLVAVEVGHTDTDNTTCLYVPSIGLLVAGDVAYNDVHQYLTECRTHESRLEWIAALDKVEALNPSAVIAGHKRVGNDDSPRIIEETRQYIRDFDRLVEGTATSRELYDRMLDLYPNRVNRGALWGSARAIKG